MSSSCTRPTENYLTNRQLIIWLCCCHIFIIWKSWKTQALQLLRELILFLSRLLFFLLNCYFNCCLLLVNNKTSNKFWLDVMLFHLVNFICNLVMYLMRATIKVFNFLFSYLSYIFALFSSLFFLWKKTYPGDALDVICIWQKG